MHTLEKGIIIKIQLSTWSNDGKRRMLLTNENKTLNKEAEAMDEIIELMNGRLKAFFLITINEEIDGFDFHEDLEDQGW